MIKMTKSMKESKYIPVVLQNEPVGVVHFTEILQSIFQILTDYWTEIMYCVNPNF